MDRNPFYPDRKWTLMCVYKKNYPITFAFRRAPATPPPTRRRQSGHRRSAGDGFRRTPPSPPGTVHAAKFDIYGPEDRETMRRPSPRNSIRRVNTYTNVTSRDVIIIIASSGLKYYCRLSGRTFIFTGNVCVCV